MADATYLSGLSVIVLMLYCPVNYGTSGRVANLECSLYNSLYRLIQEQLSFTQANS